jgi:hypothetical protein
VAQCGGKICPHFRYCKDYQPGLKVKVPVFFIFQFELF